MVIIRLILLYEYEKRLVALDNDGIWRIILAGCIHCVPTVEVQRHLHPSVYLIVLTKQT